MKIQKNNLVLIGFILTIIVLVLMKKQSGIDPGNSKILESEIIEHIQFLSDDSRKGRYPGTNESKDAISYIIDHWKAIGLKPGGIDGGFTQPFDISEGTEIGEMTSLKIGEDKLNPAIDFIPMPFSGNGSFSGSAVFAGYGFNMSEEPNWDDYSNIDVNGKWVMVMVDAPEQVHPHSPYFGHASLNKKMMVARDHNALGIIFISKDENRELPNFDHTAASSTKSIPAIQLSGEAANTLLKPFGQSIASIQEIMDSSLETIQFELDDILISTMIELEEKTIQGNNVVGIIRGNDPVLKDEFIVLGAHFDHLGMGGAHTGSRKRDTTAVHNGADDNASGTSGILELSHKLYENRKSLKRSIAFVAFDAEEKGLLGSKYFIENSKVVSPEDISTMINLDMVGRLRDSTIMVGAVGTSPSFEPLLDNLFAESDLSFTKSMEGYGPSDHSSFYVKNVPVLFFFTGAHSEYHLPEDDWELINTHGEKLILDFVYNLTMILNTNNKRPIFSEAGPKEAPKGRRIRGVTLGIIPSYGGGSKEGMKIDGVTSQESPAGKAGMIKGDVIIEINGKSILNIREYMGRMGELKKGQKIKVKVLRNNKTIEMDVQL